MLLAVALLQVHWVHVWHDGRRAHRSPLQAHNNSFHRHDACAAVQQAAKRMQAVLWGLCWRRESPHHVTGIRQDEVSWYVLEFDLWNYILHIILFLTGILKWRTGRQRFPLMLQSKETYWWWYIMQDPHLEGVCKPRCTDMRTHTHTHIRYKCVVP